MLQKDGEIIIIIVIGTLMFLLLGIFIISFLFFFQKRHNKNIQEKNQLKSAFQNELLTAQLEMQEQTLHNVSQEIHDNIGQVLSFVKLSLGTADQLGDEEKNSRIAESKQLVAQAINDLRDLSKSLSFDNIADRGLLYTIQHEIDRINKSGLLIIVLNITGEPYGLGTQRELVLFRILQESVNNALKHSGGKYLNINLQYQPGLFILTVADDGCGFDYREAQNKKGSGLKNIRNRAGLIGAIVAVESSPGHGSAIKVTLNPFEHDAYIRKNDTGSTG